jgi:hypothetical protein
LPKELREDFVKLGADLTRVAAIGDEGTVAATTATMSEPEAREYTKAIVSMYDKIVRREPK